MKTTWCCRIVLILCLAAPSALAGMPRLVSATYVGTAGDDDLQDAAFLDKGGIVVVGNMDRVIPPDALGLNTKRRQDGSGATVLGVPAKPSWLRAGFAAGFTPDGRTLLWSVQFARGIVFLTSVASTKSGLYIGGYATAGFEPLLQPLEGMHPAITNADVLPPDKQPDIPATAAGRPLTIRTLHHGHKGAVPFIARLDPHKGTITAGTFLKGHLFGWNVAMPLYEQEWSPVGIAELPGGDLVVHHDGGVPGHYYYACDHITRLTPDCKRAVWSVDLYHPEVNPPEKVSRYRRDFPNWTHPVFGQVRIQRLRTDPVGHIYAGGWSVSKVASGPWWCPFLWKFAPEDGRVLWKAYSFDPFSGRRGNIHGLVSDSTIRSIRCVGTNTVLVAGLSDGGNTVLRRDPRDCTKGSGTWVNKFHGMRARELYVGHAMRLDANTRECQAGTMFGSYAEPRGHDGRYEPAWPVDLVDLPGDRILIVGRHGRNYGMSPELWFSPNADAGMFIAVRKPHFGSRFSINIPAAIPYALCRRGTRCVVTGIAGKTTPVKHARFPRHAGGLDGYLVVMDCPE